MERRGEPSNRLALLCYINGAKFFCVLRQSESGYSFFLAYSAF